MNSQERLRMKGRPRAASPGTSFPCPFQSHLCSKPLGLILLATVPAVSHDFLGPPGPLAPDFAGPFPPALDDSSRTPVKNNLFLVTSSGCCVASFHPLLQPFLLPFQWVCLVPKAFPYHSGRCLDERHTPRQWGWGGLSGAWQQKGL